jgi:hypothetical protein
MTFELEPISVGDILRGLMFLLAGVLAWIYVTDRSDSRDDKKGYQDRISKLEAQTRADMDAGFRRVYDRIDSMQSKMNEQHHELLLLLVSRGKERE